MILRVDEETGLKRQILIPSLLLTGEIFVLATTAKTKVIEDTKVKANQAKTGMQSHHTFLSNLVLSEITGSAAAQKSVWCEVK